MRELYLSTALAMIFAAVTGATAQAQAQGDGGREICWQNFAVADENDDGLISGREAGFNVEMRFDRIDDDNDGFVSKQEYQDCLVDITAEPSDGAQQSRSEERFAEMDTDKDENVTLQEYMGYGRDSYRAAAGDEGAVPREEFDETLLGHLAGPTGADWNRDQSVSEAEAAGSIGRTFAMLDADGNGALSQNEWVASGARIEVERRFAALDADDDGRLGKDELRSAIERGYQTAAAAGEPVSVWSYTIYYLTPVASTQQAQTGPSSQGGADTSSKATEGSKGAGAGQAADASATEPMSKDKIRGILATNGYDEISDLTLRDGTYHAQARKGGETVTVAIDAETGVVLETAK